MTTHLNNARRVGYTAAGLVAGAGLIELAAGSNSWTGNKSEPTTLGILTVVLAGIIAASAAATQRIQTTIAGLAVAAGLAVPALLSLTTAGRISVPGAVAGVTAAGLVAADGKNRGSVKTAISEAWPNVLIAVLATIYLAFGVVAGPIGVLGILGAATMIGSLYLRQRSTRLAATILVVGVVPFAVAAWWTLVIPITALLVLTIELPQLRTQTASKATEPPQPLSPSSIRHNGDRPSAQDRALVRAGSRGPNEDDPPGRI